MTKLTLKQMILNKIDDSPRGFVDELACISGYSNGSNLKKVLRSEDKEFDKFNGLIALIKFLFGKDEQKILVDYSKTLDPCNKSARCMVEYLSNKRLLEAMKELIDKMILCKNKESNEWGKVYNIQYDWHVNYYNLNIESFINTINDTKTNVKELKVYLYLLKFYAFYHKQNYKMAFEMSKLIPSGIKEIKDDYIRNVYNARLNEALSYIYLRVFNNPEESRKKSEQVLESSIGLGAISYAHYTIGCSYMFTSYDNSLKYLEESSELYRTAKRDSVVKDIKEKIDILNVLWGKNEDIYSITAKLLQDAKTGILQKSTLEKCKEQIDESYYFLIKGINENDNDLLLQSVIQFIKIGDTFFSNIPKIELIKNGFNENVLNALISLNHA